MNANEMHTFEVERANATLVKWTPKTRGDDNKPYVVMELDFDLTIDDLAMFSPTIRGCWYDNEDAPKLRSPEIKGPFAVIGSVIGATVIMHIGLGGKSDMKLQGCDVSGYQLDPKDGGRVTFSCNVSCNPTKTQVGEFFVLQKCVVDVSVVPSQSTLDLEGGGASDKAQPAAKPPSASKELRVIDVFPNHGQTIEGESTSSTDAGPKAIGATLQLEDKSTKQPAVKKPVKKGGEAADKKIAAIKKSAAVKKPTPKKTPAKKPAAVKKAGQGPKKLVTTPKKLDAKKPALKQAAKPKVPSVPKAPKVSTPTTRVPDPEARAAADAASDAGTGAA